VAGVIIGSLPVVTALLSARLIPDVPFRAVWEPAVSPSAVVSADRADVGLRDLVARVLRPWLVGGDEADVARRVGHAADAVMAVLPERADRATLLREAADHLARQADELWMPGTKAHTVMHADADELRRLADEASRVAAEEQPAETQWPGERCGLCPPGTRTRHLEDHMVQVHGARPTARPAVGEQPDTQTREARLVELFVRYRVQLRETADANWKPGHPSLDYEDREDADESAALSRELYPRREYRVVTRTTTITEQP
jgi:hypothetical protein